MAALVGCTFRGMDMHREHADCFATAWPHEGSDLEPDAALHFGRLENGVRYVLMHNDEPRDRVALYLDVQSGSLHEEEHQRGLAHYLEHMLFNGTTHYPPGELIEYFQSIGMAFGADTNAHTTYDETVYKLLLPGGGEEILDEGFLVLADYARGALLLEEEVDRERGVILAEKRARDTASARVWKQRMAFEFSGTKVAERDPIGIEEVLYKADNEQLRSYYDAWYRPENMIVIAVGDMDVSKAETLLNKNFRSLRGASVDVQCPDLGKVSVTGREAMYLYEPELGYTEVSLATVYNFEPQADTRAWKRQQLQQKLAVSAFQHRLDKRSEQAGSPFTKAKVYNGLFVHRYGYATLVARTGADRWQESMGLLIRTLEQVLTQGITEAELVRVKKELAAYLHKQVRTAATRDSSMLAQQITHKLNNHQVFLSPEQELELYQPMLETITVDQVNRAMRELWDHGQRLYEVLGTADLRHKTTTPKQQILAVVEEPMVGSQLREVVDDATVPFPYLPVPPQPAAIVTTELIEQIDVRRVQLANNILLQIKPTKFQKNQVQVAVRFGSGKLAEPKPGMAMVAEQFVEHGGLGQLTIEQLKEALAGTSIDCRFTVAPESFVFFGEGLSTELEQLLQLLSAYLKDPGFRDTAWNKTMQRMEQMYEQMASSVEGVMRIQGEPFLADGRQMYAVADHRQVANLERAEIVSWLTPVFRSAALEIDVVGDVDPDRVIFLVSRYFGDRPGQKTVVPTMETANFPTGKRKHLVVDSAIDKALVTVAWKTDDFWDVSRTRTLNVLALLLDDRLRVTIREKLGATYSPEVYNRSSKVFEGYGVLRAQLVVAPDQAERVAQIVLEEANQLARVPIGQEELQRIVHPALTSIRDLKRTNRYWRDSVLGLAGRHPEQLQWPLSISADYQAVSADDLRQLAAEYLQPAQAAVVIVSNTN